MLDLLDIMGLDSLFCIANLSFQVANVYLAFTVVRVFEGNFGGKN